MPKPVMAPSLRLFLCSASLGVLTCTGALAQATAPNAPPTAPSASPTGAPSRPTQVPVVFAGHMGRRAALMIDGQPYTVAVGETVAGIKLLEVSSTTARVEREGQVVVLNLGAVPAGPASPPPSRDLVIRGDPDGHFFTFGAINGLPVRFMIDTGATSITMSQSEADRLGLDWRSGQRTQAATANGSVPANMVSLAAVKVGELAAANLMAVVVPAQLPNVLLGNNFLGRFNLRRENDVMRLEPKP